MTRKIICIISLAIFITPITSLASEKSILSRMMHKIASIKQSLVRDHGKQRKLQNDLKKTETNSGRVSKQLGTTKKNLRQQKILFMRLKTQQEQLDTALTIQKNLLAQQITTSYILGRESYLKLLLNQQKISDTGRILTYYRFINQSRLKTIGEAKDTLEQLKKNQEKIQEKYQVLNNLKLKQTSQKKQLNKEKKNRLILIVRINKHIKNRKQRLKKLIENKKQLEKTIAAVSRKSVHFPRSNFSNLHHRLHWPTAGKVMKIFGTQIEQSELRWGGILIKAPEGQAVYAVANGKVVFAKWLAGYGLLLIISHGHGYMTLYARNHALYKNLGDTVHRGNLIATVGQTGGHQHSALYFSVRHNGKPINPVLFIGR